MSAATGGLAAVAIMGFHACAGIVFSIIAIVSTIIGIVNYDNAPSCALNELTLPLWCIISGCICVGYFILTIPCYCFISYDGIIKYVISVTIIFALLTFSWAIMGIVILVTSTCTMSTLVTIVITQIIFDFIGVVLTIVSGVYLGCTINEEPS